MSEILLVTGMSGAGRTTALKALEDIGFEAVDNLPVTLLDHLLRPGDRVPARLVVGIDARTRAFDPEGLAPMLRSLSGALHTKVTLLFLDCDDEMLGRRYSETRRRHPLAIDRPVTDGIARERELLEPLRERADLVLDTSQLSIHDLRRVLTGQFGDRAEATLFLTVMSFAFRRGLPREADLVFDVRFLSNPHYVDALRPLTGRDPAVRAYVEQDPNYALLLERFDALVRPLFPAYQREGRSYFTIAFGCTGGRHRSVAVAEAFAEGLRGTPWPVLVRHRDTTEGEGLPFAISFPRHPERGTE